VLIFITKGIPAVSIQQKQGSDIAEIFHFLNVHYKIFIIFAERFRNCLFIFEAAVSLFLLYKKFNDLKSNNFLKIQDYGL